jgi:hypothetical protein
MNTTSARFVPALLALGSVCVGSVGTTSCASDGFGRVRSTPRLIVELDANATNPGSREAPLNLLVNTPTSFRVTIRALALDGSVDPTFNRYVRVSSKPGAVAPLSGADTEGRNVLLKNGSSEPLNVAVTNAYGITYIVADDLGYVPVDPLRDPPPACANGIDDDGDGVVDAPADDGCAFANDDDERGGTFAEGVSTPIYFRLPRIADIRGLTCDATQPPSCSGNGSTPYPKQPIQVDTGYREDGTFAFDTVVTRIASDGFYVNDLGDVRGGFNSIFAFNFNAPPRMRTCDRIKTYGGTASEFFGFTQMSYPTWTLEEWDPARRPCLVPEPTRLTPELLGRTPDLLRVSGNLVRVETDPSGAQKLKVTPKFGPGDVQKGPDGRYTPTLDASNCDFDKNGRVTFVKGTPEGDCATACSTDPECTEWSSYASRSTFRLTVTDGNGRSAAVQADASTAAGFDPVAVKGKPLRSFAGTLHYFSGGSQFTLEARCADDIIVPLTETPFVSDRTCTTDLDCTDAAPKGLALSADYKCAQLAAGKACRKLVPERPDVREPPPLACVFPRTFLDNNPQ